MASLSSRFGEMVSARGHPRADERAGQERIGRVETGTNYYLHRTADPCPTCGHPRTSDKIHIGKSTYGWVFLWRGYRDQDTAIPGRELATPEQWWQYLNEHTSAGAAIRDQFGDEMGLGELRALVAQRAQPLPGDGLPPRRHVRQSPTDAVAVGDSNVLFSEFS